MVFIMLLKLLLRTPKTHVDINNSKLSPAHGEFRHFKAKGIFFFFSVFLVFVFWYFVFVVSVFVFW